jgi:hypothetical protein
MVNKSITFIVLATLCLSLRSASKHVAVFIPAKKKPSHHITCTDISRQEDRLEAVGVGAKRLPHFFRTRTPAQAR